MGNVTQITNLVDSTYWKFAYDNLRQMRYATDYAADGAAQNRYKYYYDNAGNLTSWKIQDDSATTTYEEHTYTYGDAQWKDLLTAFDGNPITYDASGNPLSYYNGRRYTMTWRNGRQLASAAVNGKTYRYEYDVNGLRTRKTNADGGYTEYYIVDGLAVAERRFTSAGVEIYTLRYSFDQNNSPVGFSIQYASETGWTNFYFAKNLQGDVIALYRWDGPKNGVLVATYKYDPWGNPLGIYNTSGNSISQTAHNVAAYNPFRYRGYRYDAETGFYYLQSRYYDPETCRFINADGMASTGQGIIGQNMFAYCLNNPVDSSDPTGQRAMGPSFVYCNDGSYISASIGVGSNSEQGLVDTHMNNPLMRAGTEDAVSTLVTCTRVENYIHSESYDANKTFWLNFLTEQAAERVVEPFLIGLGYASGGIAGALITTFLAEQISSFLDDDIPAGEYAQYAVITVDKYPYTAPGSDSPSGWRNVTTVTYYIDKRIGVHSEWVYTAQWGYEWFFLSNSGG